MRRTLALLAVCAAGIGLLCLTGMWMVRKPKDREMEKIRLRAILWDYEKNIYDQRIIEAFEQDNPDIEIEVISADPSTYVDSLISRLDGGDLIDIIYINQQHTNFPPVAARDLLYGLDRFVESGEVDLSLYPDVSALRSTQTGELLALPYRKDKLHLYYNKDLFDLAGIPYPQEGITWEEFERTAKRMQSVLDEAAPGKYSAIFLLNDWRLIHMFSGKTFDYTQDSLEPVAKGLALLLRMENERLIPPLTKLSMVNASQHMFETGQYAMFVHGTWYVNYLYKDGESGQLDFKWGMTSCPVFEGNPPNDGAWMASVGINRHTRHLEAAWRYVKYVTGIEGAQIMAQEMILPAYGGEIIRNTIEANDAVADCGIDQMFTVFKTPLRMLDEREISQLTHFGSLFYQAKLRLISMEEMLDGMEKYREEE